jgi:hypothetical protein
MNSESEHLVAAKRLRAALDQAAEAMIDARLDGLLAAEQPLAAAVAAWPAGTPSGSTGNEQLREELTRLQASLERCRRLGLLLDAFATASLSSGGCSRNYDSTGSAPPRGVAGRRSWEARA